MCSGIWDYYVLVRKQKSPKSPQTHRTIMKYKITELTIQLVT